MSYVVIDGKGVFTSANKEFVNCKAKYKDKLISVIAELQGEYAHESHQFPNSGLHKQEGQRGLWRAYIDKTSGYRLILKIEKKEKKIFLMGITNPEEHDRKFQRVTEGRFK